MPLGLQTVVAGACLWLGLALLFVALLFVRNRRRTRTMLTTGVVLVGVALALMVGMMRFGPDVALP
jgi:hypothetical protein